MDFEDSRLYALAMDNGFEGGTKKSFDAWVEEEFGSFFDESD